MGMTGTPAGMDTGQIMAGLLSLDGVMIKAAGLPNEAVFRNAEARLFQALGRSFLARARRAVNSATSSLTGDGPATKADVARIIAKLEAAFKGWDKEMAPIIRAVAAEAYRSGKTQVWQRATGKIKHPIGTDSPHLEVIKAKKPPKTKLDVKPSFGAKDEAAINALGNRQVLWVGRHYSENLAGRVAAVTEQVALNDGLGRREAGVKLKQSLEAEFGLSGESFDRGGLDLPAGWNGTTPQYFEMLSANTVTNSRAQGGISAMIDAGVSTYTIVSAGDERTCDRCNYMDGQHFQANEAAARMAKENDAEDPDEVKSIHPWASGAAELRGSKNLMEDGFGFPPFHGRCRCTVDITED